MKSWRVCDAVLPYNEFEVEFFSFSFRVIVGRLLIKFQLLIGETLGGAAFQSGINNHESNSFPVIPAVPGSKLP
jgi:hypothetical protein